MIAAFYKWITNVMLVLRFHSKLKTQKVRGLLAPFTFLHMLSIKGSILWHLNWWKLLSEQLHSQYFISKLIILRGRAVGSLLFPQTQKSLLHSKVWFYFELISFRIETYRFKFRFCFYYQLPSNAEWVSVSVGFPSCKIRVIIASLLYFSEMLRGLKNITFLISVEHSAILKKVWRSHRIVFILTSWNTLMKKTVRNAAAERKCEPENPLCDWWVWEESMIIVYTLGLAGIFLLKKLSIL